MLKKTVLIVKAGPTQARRDVAKTVYLYTITSLAAMSRKDRCENEASAKDAINNWII